MIKQIPHVTDVMPTLVKLNSCGTNLDLVNIHGVPVETLSRFRSFHVIDGAFDGFAKEQASALVGREIAERRGWKVGEAADINGINFNIRGIFDDGGSTYESMVVVHLNFLQQSIGIGAGSYSTQLYVKVDDGKHADAVAAAIDAGFDSDVIQTDTKPERAFLAKTIREFSEIIRFSKILGYIAVAILLLLVANTIYMAVQDRWKETAVLQTLGFTPFRVLALIVTESFILSTLGGMLGAGSAWLVLSHGNFGVAIEGYQVAFAPDQYVTVLAMIVAGAVGLLGGILPGVSAARMNIVDGLRKL